MREFSEPRRRGAFAPSSKAFYALDGANIDYPKTIVLSRKGAASNEEPSDGDDTQPETDPEPPEANIGENG